MKISVSSYISDRSLKINFQDCTGRRGEGAHSKLAGLFEPYKKGQKKGKNGWKMGKMFFTYPAEYANSRFVNKTSASFSTIVFWSFKPDT